MWMSRIVAPALLVALVAGSAGAQERRTSALEPRVSLTFKEYLEPFAKVDDARACRDLCLREPRCTGWTYYHPTFRGNMKGWESLPRTCVLGADLMDRKRNLADRTSGEVKTVVPGKAVKRRPKKAAEE